MPVNRHIPIAFFVGTLSVFVYLLLAAPIGGPPEAPGMTMFSVLFRSHLARDQVALSVATACFAPPILRAWVVYYC